MEVESAKAVTDDCTTCEQNPEQSNSYSTEAMQSRDTDNPTRYLKVRAVVNGTSMDNWV
jgi:hypothetical protein